MERGSRAVLGAGENDAWLECGVWDQGLRRGAPDPAGRCAVCSGECRNVEG